MFDHPAVLCHLDLLIALLRRLMAGVFWAKRRTAPPPAPIRACLEKTEAALAQAIRASLAEHGAPFPHGADHDLIAWFVKAHGASRPRAARPKLAPAPQTSSSAHFAAAGASALSRPQIAPAPPKARAPPRRNPI
jgi:hypothetical protein